MAQTKKKRRRKQRGTQAGAIDTRRKARPKNRAEARSQAKSSGGKPKSSRGSVIDRPPTWQGAGFRGLVAAGVFTFILLAIFKKPPVYSIGIGLLMLVLYIPAGYYMDTVLWRRRERARIRARDKG